MGESNLLDGVVVALEGEGAIVRTSGGRRVRAARTAARAGDRVLVLLRPDAAALADADGADHEGFVGVVEDVSDPGPVERGRVRLDGGERVTVTRPRRAGGPALRRGARIALVWPPAEVRLLAPEP